MAATRKLDQSKLMLEAGRSGNAARQQSANRAEGARQFDESVDQQNLNRSQRQWEERRRARDAREKPWTPSSILDQGPALRQEEIQRGAVQEAASAQQAQGDREQQQLDMQKEQIGLQRDELNLQGAAQGFEQQDPRMRDLMGEMQRGGEQMRQGLESTGQGKKWVPTEQAKDAQASKEKLATYDAETRRIGELADWKRASNAFNMAAIREQNADTATARKEQQEVMEIKRKELIAPLRNASERLDRMATGKGSPSDWQKVREETGLYMNPHKPGELQAISDDIDGNRWSPRLQAFMQQRENVRVMQFIAEIGELPSGNYVDMSSPAMVEYTQTAMALRQVAESPTNSQLQTYQSPADRIREQNKRAAQAVLKGLPVLTAEEQIGQGAERHEGMNQAQGAGQEPQEPTHEQRRARAAGPEGEGFGPAVSNITPDEADRRAQQPPQKLGPNPTPEEQRAARHRKSRSTGISGLKPYK